MVSLLHMKVILLQDVEDVGKKYEIKEVKPGFGRNFLLTKKLAKLATKENLKWLESQKETMEKEAEENLKASQELASKLDDLEVPMVVKVGPEGQLFESINPVKIAEALKGMGIEVKKSQIKMEEPIKELGEFPVKVVLDHNLESDIRVIVSGQTPAEDNG